MLIRVNFRFKMSSEEAERIRNLASQVPEVRIPEGYVAPKKLSWPKSATDLLMRTIDTVDGGKFKQLQQEPVVVQEYISNMPYSNILIL